MACNRGWISLWTTPTTCQRLEHGGSSRYWLTDHHDRESETKQLTNSGMHNSAMLTKIAGDQEYVVFFE